MKKSFIEEIKPIFNDLQKINQMALALIALVLYALPFLMIFLVKAGVKFADFADLINFFYNTGISLAGVITFGALILTFFDWLTERSSERMGQSVKTLLISVGYLIWILSAWAIVNYAMNKAGYSVDVSKGDAAITRIFPGSSGNSFSQ